jgi:hypothetical protein
MGWGGVHEHIKKKEMRRVGVILDKEMCSVQVHIR